MINWRTGSVCDDSGVRRLHFGKLNRFAVLFLFKVLKPVMLGLQANKTGLGGR